MTRHLNIKRIIAALALLGGLVIAASSVQAGDKKIVLPRSIVQMAEIPLLYTDKDALDYRYRGRLVYWEENGVRIYARLEDLAGMAGKHDSRCPFDGKTEQETLDVTLGHIPNSGRDVDLGRYYSTFIVDVLTNNERMDMARLHERTMEAWQRNLQDVLRIVGSAGAQQGIQCLALLGNVAVEDVAGERFHKRLFWRTETKPNGKTVKYFFTANEFFEKQAD